MIKQIPNWEKMLHEPKNPKNWYKVYQRLRSQSQKEEDEAARNLKAKLDNIKNEQSKHTAKQVELNVVKLPESMKAHLPVIRLPRTSQFFNKPNLYPKPENRFQTSKEPTNVKAKSKIAQFRKDALAHGHFPKQQNGIVSSRDMQIRPRPTKTTVTVAPAAMLHEYRNRAPPKPFDPMTETTTPSNPRKRRIEHTESISPEKSLTEQREKRLKALTGPPCTDKSSPTGIIASVQNSEPSTTCSRQDQVSKSPSKSKGGPSMQTSHPLGPNSPSSLIRQSTRPGLTPGSTIPREKLSSPMGRIIRPPRPRKPEFQASPLVAPKPNRLV